MAWYILAFTKNKNKNGQQTAKKERQLKRSYHQPSGWRYPVAPHIGMQNCRQLDRTIFLLSIFQHCDHRPADSNARPVQCMHKLDVAIVVTKPRLHAACLKRPTI
jgi:hypothetical protein